MPRMDSVKQLVSTREKAVMAAAPVKLFARIPVNKTVPTGVTMLNLAASGDARGGWKRGCIVHIVGDSDTGKSVLAETTPAEAAQDKRFLKYKFIKDDSESSDSFPTEEMFGRELARRLKAPNADGSSSYYIQDFFFTVYGLTRKPEPFIYLMDSVDGLEGIENVEKFEANAELYAKGKEMKGSYGDGKAKAASDNLRKIKVALKDSESLLIAVSQTRDNINPDTMAEKTHAGGRAWKFYSQYQLWLAPRGKLSKSVKGKQQEVGTLARVKLTKNHATGKHLDFVLPMYYGYGIDDEQCTLRWMVAKEGAGEVWKMSAGTLTTRGECGLNKAYKLGDFIRAVRTSPEFKERYLDAVQMAWDEMEALLRRPGRYSGTCEDAPEGDFE